MDVKKSYLTCHGARCCGGSKISHQASTGEAAIEHATEIGAFDMALELANQNMVKKSPELCLRHALFLEDDERFREAEEEFIKANKPKEAIDMYVHQQDWVSLLFLIYIAQLRQIKCRRFQGCRRALPLCLTSRVGTGDVSGG